MKNTELLFRIEQAWNAMQPFRDTRRRNINYIYGDQWSDLVSDGEGHLLTERERITRRTGAVPLQNNHLINICSPSASASPDAPEPYRCRTTTLLK